jgi:hypothetical protein
MISVMADRARSPTYFKGENLGSSKVMLEFTALACLD